MACNDLDSSVMPPSQSPKVELTCCLWRTVPLQKVSFVLLGRVLPSGREIMVRLTELGWVAGLPVGQAESEELQAG